MSEMKAGEDSPAPEIKMAHGAGNGPMPENLGSRDESKMRDEEEPPQDGPNTGGGNGDEPAEQDWESDPRKPIGTDSESKGGKQEDEERRDR